jgi:hypothetical protein
VITKARKLGLAPRSRPHSTPASRTPARSPAAARPHGPGHRRLSRQNSASGGAHPASSEPSLFTNRTERPPEAHGYMPGHRPAVSGPGRLGQVTAALRLVWVSVIFGIGSGRHWPVTLRGHWRLRSGRSCCGQAPAVCPVALIPEQQ